MKEEEGLPAIVRAREYRLYDRRGRRYIDFYLNGGRALLGHRPPGVAQAMKGTVDRGLVAEYPSPWSGRLARLLQKRFGESLEVRIYPGVESASAAAGAHLADLSFEEGKRQCREEGKLPLWRPGGLEPAEEARLLDGEWGRIFLPLLPYPGRFAPAVLCLLPGAPQLQTPAPVSPLLEAMLVKVTAALVKWEQTADTRIWSTFDYAGVERRGPYFRLSGSEGEYKALRRRLMEQGVLLPPKRSTPAVIPGEFTSGEVKPLRKELEQLYGNS